jgi:hypothetical protein
MTSFIRQVEKLAAKYGCDAIFGGSRCGSHLAIVHPKKGRIATSSTTPRSEGNSLKVLECEMKRALRAAAESNTAPSPSGESQPKHRPFSGYPKTTNEQRRQRKLLRLQSCM